MFKGKTLGDKNYSRASIKQCDNSNRAESNGLLTLRFVLVRILAWVIPIRQCEIFSSVSHLCSMQVPCKTDRKIVHVRFLHILKYSFQCCCDALQRPFYTPGNSYHTLKKTAQLRTPRIRTQDQVSCVQYSHPETWTCTNSLHSQRYLFNACFYREDLLKLKEAKNLSIKSCTWV